MRRGVVVKSKVAGDLTGSMRKTPLHSLLVYSNFLVSPCASSAIGLLLLCFLVSPHQLPTSTHPITPHSILMLPTCYDKSYTAFFIVPYF